MKQEIYVKEMPDICDECPFQNKTTYECVLLPKYNKKPFLQSCPLKSLHDHDKELMGKVLEKTKTFVRENTYICGGNATREDIITSSSYNQALRDVLDFMETLQKDIKK